MLKKIRKLKRKIKLNIIGLFRSVEVYDNYVKNILPALQFKNKVRLLLSRKAWIPIGADSPFGRLVFLKGEYVNCGSPIVKFDRLSDMGKEFNLKGSPCRWTHWMEV